MLRLDEIKAELADRRLSIVSAVTGIHYNTLRQVRDDPNANPTYKVMSALSDYITERRNNDSSKVS